MRNQKPYRYFIFDVDDTLLDFGSAFRSAQETVAKLLGAKCSDAFRKTDEAAGWKAWNVMRLNDTDCEDIQRRYHELYDGYLRLHYRLLLDALGTEGDPAKLADRYEEAIANSSVLTEECIPAVFRELTKKYEIILATNGKVRIQEKRIGILKPYVHKLFVSEAMGTIKPAPEFYHAILCDLGCSPKDCLMIGDSITNDMAGAKDAGMDVCYYNPQNKEIGTAVSCEYIISSIGELVPLFMTD